MTDFASNPPRSHKPRRHRTVEFNLYFTAIFLLSLPGATIGWVREVARRRSLNLRGPLARAWAKAESTTPLIFSV